MLKLIKTKSLITLKKYLFWTFRYKLLKYADVKQINELDKQKLKLSSELTKNNLVIGGLLAVKIQNNFALETNFNYEIEIFKTKNLEPELNIEKLEKISQDNSKIQYKLDKINIKQIINKTISSSCIRNIKFYNYNIKILNIYAAISYLIDELIYLISNENNEEKSQHLFSNFVLLLQKINHKLYKLESTISNIKAENNFIYYINIQKDRNKITNDLEKISNWLSNLKLSIDFDKSLVMRLFKNAVY